MQVIQPRLQSWGELYPNQLDGLALWLDAIDQNSLLASDGSVIEDGEAVALVSEKSGNSAENCLVLNGVAGNYASVPDSAALSITGDIDIRVRVALNDWTPGPTQAILSKHTPDGDQRSYRLVVSNNLPHPLRFQWSPLGTLASLVTIDSTVAPTVSDFSKLWVRVTLDVDNGAGGNTVTFYTGGSGDTPAWVQLGDPVVTAGVTSIYDSTAVLELGSTSVGTIDQMAGRIYRAQIRNGIDGTTVFDADFTTVPKLATSFTESSSNAATVTINSTGATGARISGARDLYQGTVANRPVFLKYNGQKYGYLNGVAGNYFSTPDSAAISITSDISLVFGGILADWTPSDSFALTGKYDTGANKRAYVLFLTPTGTLRFIASADGTNTGVFDATSTASVPFSDGAKGYVMAFADVDNGASGKSVTFYTSTDGITWTQLGDVVTSAGTYTIYDSDVALMVGCSLSSGVPVQLVSGRVLLGQVWSGDALSGGTLVADFDASRYTSGTTFTASTGETWTLNGGAHIVTRTGLYFDGSNDYLKSASFSLSQPESVYFIGQQVSWTQSDSLFDGNTTGSMIAINVVSSPTYELRANTPGVLRNSDLAVKTDGIIAAVFNGASSSNRVNRGTAVTGDPGSTAADGFTVGARGNGDSLYSNIFVHEILIYDTTAQSTATQDRVALYAGKKWKFAV